MCLCWMKRRTSDVNRKWCADLDLFSVVKIRINKGRHRIIIYLNKSWVCVFVMNPEPHHPPNSLFLISKWACSHTQSYTYQNRKFVLLFFSSSLVSSRSFIYSSDLLFTCSHFTSSQSSRIIHYSASVSSKTEIISG